MSARFFNTAGPVKCDIHYCLPPLERLDLPEVLRLIDQQKYFMLHAPRQTGKTSCLLALRDYLNERDQYRSVYVNVEVGQAARENVDDAMRAILSALGSWARISLGDVFVHSIWPEVLTRSGGNAALGEVLSRWAEHSPQPLVLFVDEIDALVGDTLISVLRQLRAGYASRPTHFPQTVILCGVRDVRDYRIHSDRDKAIITGGSAFNIKAESLRLGDFDYRETMALLQQHTDETGQIFEPQALELIWELTNGQPWLVNAVAYETCFKMKAGRDRTLPITSAMVTEAKENLIMRRETHLDQLADKLKEERVRRVIQLLLMGSDAPGILPEDDLQYVADLGLIRRKPSVMIANPIYREIIPRALSSVAQDTIVQEPAWYVRPDGQLDLSKLLTAFQQFFRENSEAWLERFDYKEAGPQLLLQAFLQRIVNSGGRVEREYGLGLRRTDLLIIWKVEDGSRKGDEREPQSVIQRAVIELKILRGSRERTIAEGLPQTWEYVDRCGAKEAHLVIFDRTPGKTWEEKLFRQEETYRERSITVWGM